MAATIPLFVTRLGRVLMAMLWGGSNIWGKDIKRV